MKKGFVLFCLGSLFLSAATAFSQTKYEPNWASLDKRPSPAWFTDAKLGIFIHFGVYSVPAWAPVNDVPTWCKYSEWYWKHSTDPNNKKAYDKFHAFHERVYGPNVKYQDFVKSFKAEMFDPNQWADILARSGAKYIVLTSKHHDGFCMWPSKQSWNWNSVDVGPHIDFVGDLTKAVRAKGVKMGLYYSLYEWFNPVFLSDANAYINEHMIPQIKDIVQTYKPDVLWTDGEWNYPSKVWKSEEILAWIFNDSDVNQTIAVNDRWGKETRGNHGGYYTTEYLSFADKKILEGKVLHPWEECRGIGGSFGYNRNERLSNYSTPQQLVHMLVTIVSRGGNLLLDIGPTADGRIPVIMEERLSQLGDWLKVNGEAIYGTKKWDKLSEDGDKIYYTSKDDAVYAIALGWPGDMMILNISEPSAETVVNLLGCQKQLHWKYKDGKMIIDTSEIGVNDLPCQWAYAFKIKGDVKP